ncbi:hypothetical protein T484DRAFT_3473354 [Baffinella frigidus]|nr:hypothetical protein T484DRAFT_3473354 [Cryptophyta sp. CCMP2293]
MGQVFCTADAVLSVPFYSQAVAFWGGLNADRVMVWRVCRPGRIGTTRCVTLPSTRTPCTTATRVSIPCPCSEVSPTATKREVEQLDGAECRKAESGQQFFSRWRALGLVSGEKL